MYSRVGAVITAAAAVVELAIVRADALDVELKGFRPLALVMYW